jgi:hypothetical protein
MRTRAEKLFFAALLAALVGFAAPAAPRALAGEDEKCSDQQNEEQSGNKKNYRTVIDENGRKVFVIEKAFVVCGKVPKPNVIYVLQASNINYEWETLKKDFLPLVLESVKKAPF